MKSSIKTKKHIIKKRTNTEVSFVEFILDSWQSSPVVQSSHLRENGEDATFSSVTRVTHEKLPELRNSNIFN